MKIQKKQEIEFFGTKTGNANSIALGYATETKNFGEVAVGVMNKSTAAKDPNSPKGVCADSDATLFSVGCGGSGERKNALEVKGDGSVLISGENGDINVADKIKEALDTDASIELVKSTESDLQYTLMVNNESRGSINIPKNQFLKNVTYDTEAKQLVFTFVTLDEEEYVERISINDLKDVYTAGDGINIDNNVISADFSSVEAAIFDEIYQCIKKDYDSSKRGDCSIVIDDSAVASGTYSIALGYNSQATADSATAVGENAQANGSNATAIGSYAQSTAYNSIALGNGVESKGEAAIALGSGAQATGMYSTALGNEAEASGNYAIALGYEVQATEEIAIALGYYTQATGSSSIAIGSNTQATNSYSVALGAQSQVTGEHAIALGAEVEAIGNNSIALGYYTITSTISKYALGGYDDNKQDVFNLEEITYSQYGNKKYLIGLGGYDGTNITTNNEAGEEVLNPNIKSVQEIINSKADLVDGKLKAEQLPKLVNITNASTAEEVVTKFNSLLADLKAKGYMTSDITA